MYLYQITVEEYKEIIKLALEHGKKTGDLMDEELVEVMKRHGKNPVCQTDKSIKDIKKEFNNNGFNVLDLTEDNKNESK